MLGYLRARLNTSCKACSDCDGDPRTTNAIRCVSQSEVFEPTRSAMPVLRPPGLKRESMRVSILARSRRANAWDNAPMKNFFKTLKVERIYQVRYETRAEARLDIVDWIEGY